MLFLQGCTLGCPGCQNQQLWPAAGGQEATPLELARMLLKLNTRRITISGGEPTEQMDGLAMLVMYLQRIMPGVHVIVYSGHTWEELFARPVGPLSLTTDGYATPFAQMLCNIDVLVDGRFVASADNSMMQMRGSRNQRPIDVYASVGCDLNALEAAVIAQRPPAPVVLDWDTPEVIVAADGSLLVPLGQTLVDDLGPSMATRRCGQTKGGEA